jgi:hypothetical protein
MAKKSTLAAALKASAGHFSDDSAPLATRSTSSAAPPSRQGKKTIAGHFDPAVSKQLHQIALDEDSSVQALLTEALNDLFIKRGRPPIA